MVRGGKINQQKPGAKGRSGSGSHPLMGKMLELLTAVEDVFLICDSSQIEARILAWLAGATDLVEGFAQGRDVYSEFASKLFQAKVYKPSDRDPVPIKKLMSLRRGFGKDAILGCGYGMGPTKFFMRCRENPDLRPLFDSGQYDFSFVDGLIKLYRSPMPRSQFWQTIERMFRIVAQFPAKSTNIMCGRPMSAGCAVELRGTVNIHFPAAGCCSILMSRLPKGTADFATATAICGGVR